MKKNMTHHAQVDRSNRIEYIMDTIGIGEPWMSYNDTPVSEKILTDTGVVIVRSIKSKKIITIYIAHMAQALEILQGAGKLKRLPLNMYNRIMDNQKYCKEWEKMA